MIIIKRNDHQLDGRNWDSDPLALLCLHGEKWAGWGEAEKAQARKELFDGIRNGEETFLGYYGMGLSVYPSGREGGEIRLETREGIGDDIGVRYDQKYTYRVVGDGADVVEYDRALDVEGRKAPHDIWRYLVEATGLYVDAPLVEGAIDDLLNWFDLDALERWHERESRSTSGMRGPGIHFLHAFGERMRKRREAA